MIISHNPYLGFSDVVAMTSQRKDIVYHHLGIKCKIIIKYCYIVWILDEISW